MVYRQLCKRYYREGDILSSFFGDIEIKKEQVDAIEAQTIVEGSSIWAPGVYHVAIDRAYTRKTDSGAKMFTVFFKDAANNNIMFSTCVQSGNDKGNKSTYVSKEGKEKLLPGIEEVKRLFDAIKVEDPAGRLAKVDHFGTNIEVMAYPDLTGKQLMIGLRTEDNEYNGEIKVQNLFEAFITSDGKNAKGEDLLESLKTKIEKAPHKKSKQKSTPSTPAADAGVAATQGWGS